MDESQPMKSMRYTRTDTPPRYSDACAPTLYTTVTKIPCIPCTPTPTHTRSANLKIEDLTHYLATKAKFANEKCMKRANFKAAIVQIEAALNGDDSGPLDGPPANAELGDTGDSADAAAAAAAADETDEPFTQSMIDVTMNESTSETVAADDSVVAEPAEIGDKSAVAADVVDAAGAVAAVAAVETTNAVEKPTASIPAKVTASKGKRTTASAEKPVAAAVTVPAAAETGTATTDTTAASPTEDTAAAPEAVPPPPSLPPVPAPAESDAEPTSRSGRKIKPKRYLHEETAETVSTPSPNKRKVSILQPLANEAEESGDKRPTKVAKVSAIDQYFGIRVADQHSFPNFRWSRNRRKHLVS